MSKSRFASVIILFFVLACPILSAENTLSVKETLGAVLDERRTEYGYELQLYKRANPKTRPVLLEMLQTPYFRPHYSAILRTLGYIGKADDVDLMIGILPEKPKETPAQWEQARPGWGWSEQLMGLFEGLALMGSRGIQPASRILKAMLKPDYWKDQYVLKIPGMGSRTRTPVEDIVPKVVNAYAITEPDALTKTADAVIAAFADDTEYEQWEWLLGEERLVNKVASFHYMEHRPVSKDDRKAMRHYYKANETALKKLDSYPLDLGEGSQPNITAIVREARSAYEKITKQVAMGKPVFDRLLDNGEPVIGEKGQLQMRRKEAMRDLKREIPILIELGHAGAAPESYTVQVTNRYELPADFKTEASPGVTQRTIRVTFSLSNSKKIVKEYLPNIPARTVNDEGKLVVILVKQGGTWHWNPFGW